MCKIRNNNSCGSKNDVKLIKMKYSNSQKYDLIKQNALDEIMNDAIKCYKTGKCKDPIKITVVKVNGCDICQKHIPEIKELMTEISNSEIGKIVPVGFEEVNYYRGGREIFKAAGCEGTPCIIRNGKKIYEGQKGKVGTLSSILGVKNPLYK